MFIYGGSLSKIVVMDSGFGGLTVLSELIKSMPDEEYIYYGDSAHAPYGEKTHDELFKRTSAICRDMVSRYDVKCFVTACNTTSSEVWSELTGAYKTYDFIGIEPALKTAVEEHPGGRILVLATTATIRGRRLKQRYEALKDKADISLLAAPGIVPYVEGMEQDGPAFKAYLRELLDSYIGNTDCVVLGCTHFPFVKEELREVLGESIVFYDSAANVAEAVKAVTHCNGDLSSSSLSDFNIPVHIHEGERKDHRDSAVIGDREGRNAKEVKEVKENDTHGESVIFLNSDPEKIATERELLQRYIHS